MTISSHLLKDYLASPPNAANEYLYGAKEDGLFGILLATEDSDIALIDGGGGQIANIQRQHYPWLALAELEDDAAHRYKAHLGKQDFLNSIEHSTDDRVANRYTSAWTRARQAAKRLGVTWRLLPDNQVEIQADGIGIDDRSAIFRNLRNISRKRRTL